MRQAAMAAILSVASVLAAQDVVRAQEVVPKELAGLQGTWIVAMVNGQDLASVGVSGDITFTGNKYVASINGSVSERGTIKVDASKTPMTIDFMIAEGSPNDTGKTQLGLVEIGKDTVRVHLNQAGNTTRPSSFEPGAGLDLIVLKKKV
jgi:uncharacterized protein (TIGR03067 family)